MGMEKEPFEISERKWDFLATIYGIIVRMDQHIHLKEEQWNENIFVDGTFDPSTLKNDFYKRTYGSRIKAVHSISRNFDFRRHPDAGLWYEEYTEQYCEFFSGDLVAELTDFLFGGKYGVAERTSYSVEHLHYLLETYFYGHLILGNEFSKELVDSWEGNGDGLDKVMELKFPARLRLTTPELSFYCRYNPVQGEFYVNRFIVEKGKIRTTTVLMSKILKIQYGYNINIQSVPDLKKVVLYQG